jgi:polysaccharide export outer membrane protein
MEKERHRRRHFFLRAILGAWLFCSGCATWRACDDPADSKLPRELEKVSLPAYVIEPPDVLLIDSLRVIPLPPYRIEPFDALLIRATATFPAEPIANIYFVDPDGTVNLGVSYGSVRVAGLTLAEARDEIEAHLNLILKEPKVVVSLAQSRALQQVRGEHLVRPDGTISLGTYGSVYVTRMTIPEAKAAIEQHLAQYLFQPEVSLDVLGYNSKVYYVIIDLAGAGEQAIRFPLTGNETVLDALCQLNGLPPAASKKRIWLARPAPAELHCDQILLVDWHAITQCGGTATNYQLLPGDRIFVKGDPLIATDTFLAKVFAPIERVFGITLLGTSTVHNFRTNGNGFTDGGIR